MTPAKTAMELGAAPNRAPVKDITLWDSLGNSCRIELYCIGPDQFELYTSKMGSVPERFIGPLDLCINKGEHWFRARKAEGFIEPANHEYQSSIN